MGVPKAVATARSPAKARNPMEEADRAKEREFYRYYHHSSRQSSPAVETPQPLPSPPPATPLAPNASDDKALTAFAQLGALRLNTRRCLISFFDRRNCYILAEATRTLSLKSGQAEFIEDSLCWGTSIFPKEKSICYYTVRLPFQHAPQPLDDYTIVPALVVNDLSQDDRFKHYPFVSGAPYSRFYAGVPIRSPSGHSIGTYCVLDENPRDGVTPFELNFLKDMAVTVMRHLTLSRATDDHKRGGVMVKSLGSFADGRSTLDEWWEPWETEPAPSAVPPETVSVPRQHRSITANTAPPQMSSQPPVAIDRMDSADSSLPSIKSTNPTSPLSGPPGSVAVTPASETVDDRNAEVATKTASSAKSEEKDLVAPELKAIFSRAAQMIVDATEAEAAVFFDAKVSTFGGLVDDDFLSDSPPEPDKPCAILGAARYRGSQNPSSPSGHSYSMSESVLKHLVRNYSHGQIFNFDDEAASTAPHSFGNDELLATSRRSDSSRSADDEVLLRDVFPQARSLVLFPLWDTHRDRWFSSVIIWSSDPMRVFTSEQELSYLAAFSNSVMAEVARLDTKLADAAKADFISSISHELRSPLHGILGMSDLLKDTPLDNQQLSHVQTIETCGKTLLDTINHVLDFAKINNLTRGTSKRKKQRTKSVRQVISPAQGHLNDIMTIVTDVDMSVLTEEALESVFAGYHFQKSTSETLEHHNSSKIEAPPISVIVDVNKSDNYVFRTQPGAWRRVIMNLFGNALKYTPAGYIKIKLQVIRSNNAGDDYSEFRLTVTDSGIGMSEGYVNNRLFHSFAQENPLSQGTGLGLSIVKQLVELLGGDVEVRSERGRGTKFTVSCPLKTSTLSPAVCAANPERERLNINKRTQGMNAHFVGFDDEGDYFPVKSFKNKNATKLMKKSLDNLCSDWFGMKVWKHGSKDAPPPDLFVTTELGAQYLRAGYSKDSSQAPSAPVLVVCQGAASAQSTTAITVPGLIFECIAQPCGPHKLAKALSSCLDRHANRLMTQATDTDTPLTTKIVQLSLKENASPISPTAVASAVLEPPRPPMTSAISAPEIRSLNSTPVNKQSAPQGLNTLCVDDNPINLRLLRTFVEKLGHRHVLAKNGVEALDAYKSSWPITTPLHSPTVEAPPQLKLDNLSGRIDVILMDINMPEMDGLEATRQIRAYERDHGLPPVTIIALTGVASSETQQEAHASGVNLFLIKPVRLADLGVVLKGVVVGDVEEGKIATGEGMTEERKPDEDTVASAKQPKTTDEHESHDTPRIDSSVSTETIKNG